MRTKTVCLRENIRTEGCRVAIEKFICTHMERHTHDVLFISFSNQFALSIETVLCAMLVHVFASEIRVQDPSTCTLATGPIPQSRTSRTV